MQDEEGSTALINATDNCLVLQDRHGKTAVNIGKKKSPVETCILSTSSGIYTQDRCFMTNPGVRQISIHFEYLWQLTNLKINPINVNTL